MAAQVTRRNLTRVNEDAIDYDLLEELVAFIDDQLAAQDGAILVFLPGEGGRDSQVGDGRDLS